MSSTQTLTRIVKRNKAIKVRQLSEIAALFEREQRLGTQLSGMNELEGDLLAQANQSLTNELPRKFLEQERAKSKEILAKVGEVKREVGAECDLIAKEKNRKIREVEKIDACIEKIEDKVRETNGTIEITREIVEIEEHQEALSARKPDGNQYA